MEQIHETWVEEYWSTKDPNEEPVVNLDEDFESALEWHIEECPSC